MVGIPFSFFSLPFSESGLRYDCERNQWNHCSHFNFTENAGAQGHGSDNDDDDDDDDYMRGPLPHQLEQNDAGSLHQEPPATHCNADSQMVDDFLSEQSNAGSSNSDGHMPRPKVNNALTEAALPSSGNAVDHPAEAPSFNSGAHLSQLLRAQCDAPSGLVSVWNSMGDFIYGRYGAAFISDKKDTSKHDTWSARLGIKGTPPHSVVELYDGFMKGSWGNGICDLSLDPSDSCLFLPRSPGTALRTSRISNPQGYLITVVRGRNVDWKLLIRDPLTLVQIEREGWNLDPHALIITLIKKGVPFQILNPRKLEGAQFYDHPGPVTHPFGKEPQYIDFLEYRQELGAFFAHYPHAYAAALSAGGILWRITMDVLPIPDEFDITRQFHPSGCISLTIDGEKYWSPQLTRLEEDVIVGVYKWAVCKANPQ